MKFLPLIPWLLFPLLCHAAEFGGQRYLELKEVAAKLGMKTRWVEKDQSVRLQSQWTRMDFEVHKRECTLNGLRIHLGFPIVESRGRLYLNESDYRHQLQPILTPQLNGPTPGLRRIVVDAGHGGKDPGAENPSIGLREKALTLDLAKRVRRLLERRGFTVSLVREKDEFLSLQERGGIANRSGADLFLSLHFNASENRAVRGVETYAFTPPNQPSSARTKLHSSDRVSYPAQRNGDWSTLAAYYVQKSLADALPSEDRGLKRARFTVLRDLHMPGLLVEGGFLTHEREGRDIGSAAYRDRIAEAIVEGILVYQRTLQRLAREAS